MRRLPSLTVTIMVLMIVAQPALSRPTTPPSSPPVPVAPALDVDDVAPADEPRFRAPNRAELKAARVRPGSGACAGAFEFTDVADGPGKLCSHGPDVYAGTATASAGGTLFRQADTIPCTSKGPFVEVFYVYEGTNKLDAANPDAQRPRIKEAIAIADKIVDESAKQRNARRQVRWKMTSGCKLSITAAKMNTDYSPGAMFKILVDRGKLSRRDKALIFVQGAGCWGLGSMYQDDRSSKSNPNNSLGSGARVQLGCIGLGDSVTLGEVAAHEMFHTLGGVQLSAPRSSGQAHCVDESDVMCYRDGPTVRMRNVCPKTIPELLDCGKNDYFNPRPKAGSYLDRKWNTAKASYLRSTAASKRERLPRPVVSMGFTAGQIIAGNAPVDVDATAPKGSKIARVLFYVNGKEVDRDTTAPFRTTIATRFDGQNGYRNGTSLSVKVRAVDSYGRFADSATRTVTVGNPTVRLTEPSGGLVASKGPSVPWSAEASAAAGRSVQKVELFVDGSLADTDTTAPYGGMFNATGLYDAALLSVRVTDSGGVTRTSAVRAIGFGEPSATVLPTYRSSNGPVTYAARVSSTASTPIADVKFYENGVLRGTDTTAPYTATWTPSSGSREVTVVATDTAGAQSDPGWDSGQLEAGTSPYTVTITAPSSGATLSGNVTVTATTTDPGVYGVQFFVDDDYGQWDDTAPYSYTLNTTQYDNGTHLIRAEVYGDGFTSSQGTPVTFSNPGGITITAPNGSVAGQQTVQVSFSGLGGASVNNVEFSAGPEFFWDQAAPWQYTFNTALHPDGPMDLRAVATLSNWSILEDWHSITLANLRTSVTAPTDGATVSGNVAVTANAWKDSEAIIEWVRFYVDGTYIGRDGTAPYAATWKTGTWAPGAHTITATVATTDGRLQTSAPRTVTLSG